ncbi:DUF2721 domain-containing protein [Sulfurimonas sp.]|uniref:DUF2721 domain-containing protein n=1 Tax=Sulfurimonas sp. TaxID=2022749 RepID=UPI0025CDC721|nr:DUF2721 domain-containing protein [Sulfurimonas sp.]
MLNTFSDSNSINTVSHLIQLAVAPVFLIAGMAGVLNVLVSRLSRIIDKSEKLTEKLESHKKDKLFDKKSCFIKKQKTYMARRIGNMNFAILFCAMTGLLICLVIMVMFMSAFFTFDGSTAISTLFIMAMASFSIALTLFLREIFMASMYFKGKF